MFQRIFFYLNADISNSGNIGCKNLSEILLGYPQYHSGDNEYSYCNLLWGMDKISYSYRSHYVVATGTYGLYRNQMLCERTGTLLGNK